MWDVILCPVCGEEIHRHRAEPISYRASIPTRFEGHASDVLTAMDAAHERVIPLFGRVGPTEWKRDRDSEAVMDTLPKIVAVVRAAENQAYRQPGLTAALAELDAKLESE